MAEDKQDEKISKGLALIRETADTLCGSLAKSGNSLTGTLKGDIDTNLAKLFKRLVEAKISISANATATKYSGVLQTDLAEDRKDNRNCNTHVLEILTPIILQQTVFQPFETKLQAKAVKPQLCGNDVWYIEESNQPGKYQPLYIWRCHSFSQRKTIASYAGLTVNDRLELDRSRGQVKIEWGSVSVNWSNGPLVFTIALKNTGNSTVHIRSIDIASESEKTKNLALPFFSQDFVIYPSEQALVPVADVTTLSKLIDSNYDNSKYVYTVSMDPNALQTLTPYSETDSVNCTGKAFGFGLSVNFEDIFGDQYRLNRTAFVLKNKCIVKPLALIYEP